jgi:uncharacterized membrane protein YsdA (DUF1294 family)
MTTLSYIVSAYFLIINIVGFVVMGIDKSRAKNNRWRIKERTLFLVAGIGGSAGSILGMKYFRHKTKHRSFVIGMPVIFLVQIVILYFISRI